ncbi:hypothetical protein AOLI_G00233530 [Acnodon oligacanthus]
MTVQSVFLQDGEDHGDPNISSGSVPDEMEDWSDRPDVADAQRSSSSERLEVKPASRGPRSPFRACKRGNRGGERVVPASRFPSPSESLRLRRGCRASGQKS